MNHTWNIVYCAFQCERLKPLSRELLGFKKAKSITTTTTNPRFGINKIMTWNEYFWIALIYYCYYPQLHLLFNWRKWLFGFIEKLQLKKQEEITIFVNLRFSRNNFIQEYCYPLVHLLRSLEISMARRSHVLHGILFDEFLIIWMFSISSIPPCTCLQHCKLCDILLGINYRLFHYSRRRFSTWTLNMMSTCSLFSNISSERPITHFCQ